MNTKCLSPWFGSNRMLAPFVSEKLTGCEWVGVPFGGGLAELVHLKARTIVVSDLHRHIINLAEVVKDDDKRGHMIDDLDKTPFHPDRLAQAQAYCQEPADIIPSLRWATEYFICSWMSRSGLAGTEREFTGKIPVRWDASGGDSAIRFRSATESLAEWGVIMQRCTFLCIDVFDFLAKVKDEKPSKTRTQNGLYIDPPFIVGGEKYTHKFGEAEHRRMAKILTGYKLVRAVVRAYEHPLMREIYREKDGWTFVELKGRKASNAEAPELLIVRN